MNFVLKMEVKYALNAAGNVKYEKAGYHSLQFSRMPRPEMRHHAREEEMITC